MAGPVDPAYRERLALLNAKFAAGLPAILARLEALRTGVQPACPDEAARRGLYEILHSLAGSSATFGFAPLGGAARCLEEGLRALDGTPAWEAWLGELDRFIGWARTAPGTPPGEG